MNDFHEDARLEVLRRCTVFAPLPADTISVLAEMMCVERYAAGEVVCEVGDRADGVCVVAEGELTVLVPGTDGERPLSVGTIFGEYAMFSRVRTAAVCARTDSVVLTLDYERFRKFLLEFPESALALLELAVDRMVENLGAATARPGTGA
jgi:CRP-like cAMP-binding protein